MTVAHSAYDMARYTRGIEAAYSGMWQRWYAGEPPAGFRVGAAAG